MSEFTVSIKAIGAGIAKLSWEAQRVPAAVLERAVSLASDDALLAQGYRRVVVEIPAGDRNAKRALHRAGFRREGTMRAAWATPAGDYEDVLLYARLATDMVYGPVGFSGVLNSVLPTKRVIGHALFRDGYGNVLLLETTYKDDWELPGGVIEPGESPRVGTCREIAEELGGLSVSLGQPSLVDWLPPYLGWSDAIEFLFDAGELSENQVAELRVGDAEIRALHWVAPEEVAERVTELSARRIELLLAGGVGHTEDGRLTL
ncbi:MAG: NUDIX hydrolase [Arachnia propionica]|nr:MAG: NUDIX hydrolase [Arachnia propionica]